MSRNEKRFNAFRKLLILTPDIHNLQFNYICIWYTLTPTFTTEHSTHSNNISFPLLNLCFYVAVYTSMYVHIFFIHIRM